ncbi:MAG: cysteine desulfurase [Candidatus Diapherotrites archaeon]|jgi:cysteine desulfurase|uniref:Cysteine desulfurase n=1 Tax=Candidatus Iainarchaeum sp. TaxID=3101447 RepID=A0A8T5GFB8_9ARCH|nr:cysteine desulfurase [Candidatus Diapherotrites archaeon]MBT7241730.1 cysteine desulfurase [Candidatus Diapherotrites archaeon]
MTKTKNIQNTAKELYMDYSATTPTRQAVLDEALPFFVEKYGNPSSFHSTGLVAKRTLQDARERVAKILNCDEKEIVFTGSGTESINLALKGIAFKNMIKNKGLGKGTFITGKIEHPAVLETLEWLEKFGFNIIEIDVDMNGIINLKQLQNDIKKNQEEGLPVLLVSIMYANNEIGTIQPLKEISEICHKYGVPLHSDGCQGAEYLPLDVTKLGVDMLTLNGSKIYGFKGTGLLYKNKNVIIESLIHGGGHENNLRAGTENIAGIVAMAKALEIAEKEKKKETIRLKKLRNYMVKKIKKEIPKVIYNGSATKRLPNNVNFSFEGIEGESILLRLNEAGIRVSTGSACASQSLDPSHVLLAIGLPHGLAHGSIRFTFGKDTTKQKIDYTIRELKSSIKFLRTISPEWNKQKSWRKR